MAKRKTKAPVKGAKADGRLAAETRRRAEAEERAAAYLWRLDLARQGASDAIAVLESYIQATDAVRRTIAALRRTLASTADMDTDTAGN